MKQIEKWLKVSLSFFLYIYICKFHANCIYIYIYTHMCVHQIEKWRKFGNLQIFKSGSGLTFENMWQIWEFASTQIRKSQPTTKSSNIWEFVTNLGIYVHANSQKSAYYQIVYTNHPKIWLFTIFIGHRSEQHVTEVVQEILKSEVYGHFLQSL